MEPGIVFVGLIGAIAVLHLAVQAGKALGSRLGLQEGAHSDQAAGQKMRDDWYVFFHCSDLYGREEPAVSAGKPVGRQVAGGRCEVPRPRPARPRARL